MSDGMKKLAPKVVAIVAWILCSMLMLADVLVVREATNDVLTFVQLKKVEATPLDGTGAHHMVMIQFGSIIEQVDRTLIVVGAVATAVLSVFIEHYFRVGVKKEDLVQRMLKVFGILIGILVVGVAVQTFV